MRALLIAFVLLAGQSNAEPVKNDIQWDDGDSGTINGMKFRLADVDAPEPRSTGSAVGPAQCESEQVAGWKAYGYMTGLTSFGPLEFEWNGETDRHGRKVGDIKVSNQSVIQAGLAAGHLRSWKHDGSKQIEDKPDWCS